MTTEFEIGHEKCRSGVCVVCYQKASRSLSAKEIQLIQEFLIEGYRSSHPDFPNGVCTGCSIMLSKKRKDPNLVIPIVEDYDPDRKTGLRSVTTCSCKICTVAKLNGPAFLLSSRKNRKKRGRPLTKTTPEIFKICANCFTKIYRGCNHSAGQCQQSRRSKVSNIMEITSPTTLQRASSRVNRESSDVPVTPLGRPKKKEEVKKELFSSVDCSGLQQDLGLSATRTKVLLRGIRLTTGSRFIIEKNAFKIVQEKNHQLDNFFELRKLVYRREDKDTKIAINIEQPTIVCSDLPALIEHILQKRQREGESLLIKISIDGGGGFLKVCLSIFDINDPSPKASSAMSKKFLESGVKRVFIIGLVPDISENYINVKRIWMNCGVENLKKKYTVATDLKLCNILLGMMNHSSCHPCAWCDITKDLLHKKGNQRTISSLMNLFWEFFESRSDKKDAKNFGNVIHPPILSNDDSNDTPVICILPPPELHLLIGPVNKMYTELEAVWPESEDWLNACNVKKEEYHGGSFAGNESRRLLRNVGRLEALSPPGSYEKFVAAFKSFNEVVSSCYGKDLHPDFSQKIDIFARDYMKLGITVTPKVHAVMYHVAEFCIMTGRGLGPWSEQTGESVHHDFKETWKRYKVNDIERPVYAEQLLKAVSIYNSQHL